MARTYDLAIIGGGINGAGIARDAAGRGLSVVLLEQGDLAGATSSASTKLIHGGLRYLEHYAFRLVSEALHEREVLWAIAPHNVRPLRFVLPHHAGLRPRWMLRLGLILYDALGNRALPRAEAIDLSHAGPGAPLQPHYTHGFAYSDCWTDDARLVVLNARDAADRGADIRVRTKVTSATRRDGLWRLQAGDENIDARALVNAAGAWVDDVARMAGVTPAAHTRLVQGSHIIVPRLFDGDHAYICQQSDGRIVFLIPYERDFTLIGTTDQDFHGDRAHVSISKDEIDYLCAAAGEYLRAQITPADVVWTYSGVCALYDDGAASAKDVTRDYVLSLDDKGPPLLSIYGGKITTYRRLAESALAKLQKHVPHSGSWTGTVALPGGDFPRDALANVIAGLRRRYPFLTPEHAGRLAHAYGTRADRVLGDARAMADLGEVFTADLTACEVDWLVREEWARSAQDILWRRTKIGLRAAPEEVARLENYLASPPREGRGQGVG